MEREDIELFSTQPESRQTCQTADINDFKVYREIDRMRGLLRFTPNEKGELIAKCAPDHYILPFLADHFTARLGDIPWMIIDEKRGLCLCKKPGKKAEILPYVPLPLENNEKTTANDKWEELWKHYHKTINNEDRNNPKCQKQFMPKRYWKYLPEM